MTLKTHDIDAPATDADEASPRYQGWRVVIVCTVMALFCWGFGFYGHGVYLVELQRSHGWPASLISSAVTVYYLFSAVLVAFVSEGLARLGPRRVVLLGIACLAVAVNLIARIEEPWQLYAVCLVMSFGWAAMSVGAITNIVGLWFEQRRGLAISIALTGASLGGIVVVPALVAIIGAAGFSAAMLAVSATMVATLVPVVILWADRPSRRAPGRLRYASDGSESFPAPAQWTRARALRNAAFWTVTAPFALALLAQVGFLVHQIAFLEPRMGRPQAAMAVAVTTAASVIGRLALGTIVDRLAPRLASAVSLLAQAAAMLAMAQASDARVLFIGSALFGLMVGNIVTFPSLIIQREFDAASFGLLIGLSTAIGQFTYAFGPGLMGLIRDLSGDYTMALWVCALLELAAAAIVLLRASRR
ncbi:MAG: MFS transporter [Xanthobacteraceae bacterium]